MKESNFRLLLPRQACYRYTNLRREIERAGRASTDTSTRRAVMLPRCRGYRLDNPIGFPIRRVTPLLKKKSKKWSRGPDSNRRVLEDPDYKSGAFNHCATPAEDKSLVRVAGVQPTTYSLGRNHSVRLSYTRFWFFEIGASWQHAV